jgi:hypothetical protein
MEIGSRLELFVDHYLIERLEGLELRMHTPRPAPRAASPVRGYYMTIIKDGSLYRAYYRDHVAGQAAGNAGHWDGGGPGEITCYAESRDGHEWVFPHLGLYGVHGPQGNNVVLAGATPCSHNFSPFLDTRPDVPTGERFKALAGRHDGGNGGLFAFVSADGLRWQKMADRPVICSTQRAFDSQNVAFWSPAEACYLCYYRAWSTAPGGLRTIARTSSPDFVHWSPATPMQANLDDEHLYTNNTQPYFRAPHIYIALPTRFLPERGGTTDILLMTSRGGARYDRFFKEAFIRPGPEPERWGDRANYAALNVVPTGPAEMSIYHAPGGRRYLLRTDGFVSVHAGHLAGEMVTWAFRFSGNALALNYSTSAAGSVRVEVLSADGSALPGYGLADCRPVVGDEIEGVVRWRHGSDVGALAGQPLRLRYVLQEADLYAMRFRPDAAAGSVAPQPSLRPGKKEGGR